VRELNAKRTAYQVARPAIVVIIIDDEQITEGMMNKVEAYVGAYQSRSAVVLKQGIQKHTGCETVVDAPEHQVHSISARGNSHVISFDACGEAELGVGMEFNPAAPLCPVSVIVPSLFELKAGREDLTIIMSVFDMIESILIRSGGNAPIGERKEIFSQNFVGLLSPGFEDRAIMEFDIDAGIESARVQFIISS